MGEDGSMAGRIHDEGINRRRADSITGQTLEERHPDLISVRRIKGEEEERRRRGRGGCGGGGR